MPSSSSPLPTSPPPSSNWLIPGRLVIGEHPSEQDALDLVQQTGVNTFVSLIGEYSVAQYRKQHYPRAIEKMLLLTRGGATGGGAGEGVQCLHYPIQDFAVTDGASLQPLVAELKRRLLADSNTVMYLHCRGGHGCVMPALISRSPSLCLCLSSSLSLSLCLSVSLSLSLSLSVALSLSLSL